MAGRSVSRCGRDVRLARRASYRQGHGCCLHLSLHAVQAPAQRITRKTQKPPPTRPPTTAPVEEDSNGKGKRKRCRIRNQRKGPDRAPGQLLASPTQEKDINDPHNSQGRSNDEERCDRCLGSGGGPCTNDDYDGAGPKQCRRNRPPWGMSEDGWWLRTGRHSTFIAGLLLDFSGPARLAWLGHPRSTAKRFLWEQTKLP